MFIYLALPSPAESSDLPETARINRAKEFLRVSTLSIGDIAEALGFDTPSYFISSFVEIKLVYIKFFRKKIQGNPFLIVLGNIGLTMPKGVR